MAPHSFGSHSPAPPPNISVRPVSARSLGEREGNPFPKPCGAMDGGAERTRTYSQRVLEKGSRQCRTLGVPARADTMLSGLFGRDFPKCLTHANNLLGYLIGIPANTTLGHHHHHRRAQPKTPHLLTFGKRNSTLALIADRLHSTAIGRHNTRPRRLNTTYNHCTHKH